MQEFKNNNKPIKIRKEKKNNSEHCVSAGNDILMV